MPVFSNNTVPGPQSVSELARALKWNIDLLFQWVYLNVDYFPSWGDTKGGLGCLIDGVGNAFDQSTLLIELLTQQEYQGNACAYTSSQFPGQPFYASATSPTLQAAYVIADATHSIGSGIQLTGSNPNEMLSNWLGVTNNSSAPSNAEKLLNGGGVPNVYNSVTNTIQISHVWVQLTLTVGETNHVYVLDPSCKLQDTSQVGYVVNSGLGISTLESAMSSETKTYSIANLISDAGGSPVSGNPYTTLTGLSRTNVREDLTTYSRNLVSYIQTNNPGARLADIIGGKSLTQISSTPYTVSTGPSTPPVPNTTVIGTPVVSATIPNGTTPAGVPNYFNQVKLELGDLNPTFNTSALYGNRLTMYYNAGATGGPQWDVYLMSPTSSTPIQSWTFSTLNAPQVEYSFVNLLNDNTYNNGLVTPGSEGQIPYCLLGFAFGPVSRNMVNYQQTCYNQNTIAPNTCDGSWGPLLNLLWMTYVAEISYLYDMIGCLTNCQNTMIATSGMTTWYYDPPYDVGDYIFNIAGGWYASSALDGDPMGVNYGPNGLVTTMHANTCESLAIQQVIGAPAISSAIVIDDAVLANDNNPPPPTGTGTQFIYQASGSNWAGVYSEIENAYYDDSSIYGAVSNTLPPTNSTVVIPATPVPWTSNLFGGVIYGFSTTTPVGEGYAGGGYVGLIGTYGVYLGGGLSNPAGQPPATFGAKRDQKKSPDPIDYQTGDYVYFFEDFSTGSQPFPYGLSFTRYYDSSKYLLNGVLGQGWRHNFSDSVTVGSDAFQSLGMDTATAGAATIVDLLVCIQLIQSENYSINYLVVNHVVRRWWQDQCSSNIATVTHGFEDMVFVRQPYLDSDTSYQYFPPPRYALSLVQTVGPPISFTLTDPQQTAKNFNSQGQWVTWTLPPASAPQVTVTLNYSSGLLSSVSNAMGRTLNFVYSGGYLSQVNDGTGRTAHYCYSGTSPYIQLSTFQDPLSNEISYDYAGTQLSLMTEYVLPANAPNPYVQNTFDSLNRVLKQADPNGYLYYYYFAGWRSEEDDPQGNSSIFCFNRYGSIITEIDKLGYITTRTFDGLERLLTETYPESNYTTWAYPSAAISGSVIGIPGYNNVMQKTYYSKPPIPLSTLTESWQYDSNWNKISQYTDRNGNIYSYTYDDPSGGNTGNLLEIQRPAIGGVNPTTSFTYNGRGQIATITELVSTGPTVNIVTQLNYASGTEELLSIVRDYGTGSHLNLTTIFGYDTGSPNVGNIVSVQNPNGNTTTFAYDLGRKIVSRTDPAPFGYVTDFTYDANGRPLTVQRQTNSTPAFQVFTWTYSIDGKILTFLDPLNYQTTLTYDNLRRLQTYTDAEEREWQFAWDPLDRVFQVTDPSDTVSESRSYTPNGWLATLEQYPGTGNAATTTYAYDIFDRPHTTTFPAPDGSYEENVSYDNNGNVLTFQNRATNLITRVFDSLNRCIRKTLPSGQGDYIYSYNLRDQLTSTGTYPTASYSFSYDTAGRFVGDGNTSVQLDANGNVTKLTFPNGSGSNYVNKSYDQLDRLISVTPSGTSPPTASLSYDALSRRTLLSFSTSEYVAYSYQLNNDLVNINHVVPGGASESVNILYGYNNTHQVTSIGVSNSTFLWQPSSTSTVTYAAANNLNQYPNITINSTKYSYSSDANGNLTSDGVNTYVSDAENRLITINSSSISYDALDRLATDSSARGWSWFGDSLVSIGTAPLNLISSDRLDDLIFAENAGTNENIHSDRLGSPIQSGGYGPFGDSPSGQLGAAGFNGQQYFSPGLYFYRSRFYNPSIGRFNQPDAISYLGGLNLYTYVLNDPQSNTDPLGLQLLQTGDSPYGAPPDNVSQPTGGTATPLGNSGIITYTWNNTPRKEPPNNKPEESKVRNTTPTGDNVAKPQFEPGHINPFSQPFPPLWIWDPATGKWTYNPFFPPLPPADLGPRPPSTPPSEPPYPPRNPFIPWGSEPFDWGGGYPPPV